MPATTYGAGVLAGLMTTQDMYLALLLTYPSPTDDGSDLVEPTAVEYARVYIDPAEWVADEGASFAYGVSISYSPLTDWGTITSYALCTAATDGEVYFFEYLIPVMNVKAGASVSMPAGTLILEVA